MPEYSRPLGDTIKKARKEKGLTQKQVAEAIGSDDRTISNMEIYKGNPKLEILYPLVRLLKIDPNDIFYPELRKESRVHNQLKFPQWLPCAYGYETQGNPNTAGSVPNFRN